VKSKAKNWTKRFIRFVTIAVVEYGKRFTLKVLPVTPLSATENIVNVLEKGYDIASKIALQKAYEDMKSKPERNEKG